MIECAYAALKLQKGAAEPMTPMLKRAPNAEREEIGEASTMDLSPPKVMQPSTMAGAVVPPPAPAAAPKVRLEGARLREAILAFIRHEGEGRAEGVSFAAVCSHTNPAPTGEAREALEQLVASGDIF